MTHKKDGIIDLLFCGFDYLRISRVRQRSTHVFLGVFKLRYRVSKQVHNKVNLLCNIPKLGKVGLCLRIFAVVVVVVVATGQPTGITPYLT